MNAAPDPSDPHDEDSIVTMRPGAGPSLGRIDQYEVLKRLGGGGYGVVYLARDTVSGVLFALKTLHPLVKRSPEELERVVEAVLSGAVKYCPHGRPVSAVVTKKELDKLFRRIV